MENINYNLIKEQIITSIATSAEFNNKVKHIAFKHGYTDNSKVLKDVKQQVLMALWEKDAFKIWTMYNTSKTSIMGTAITIAKRQFYTHTKYNNPRHSLISTIAHTSTYKTLQEVTTTGVESVEGESTVYLNPVDDTESDSQYNVLEKFYEYLNEEEISFLEEEMDMFGHRKRGKPTRAYSEMKTKVYDKVRMIAKDKGIKV